MHVRLFKWCHYNYYALLTPNRPDQWGLWACAVFKDDIVFLAYYKRGFIEENAEVFEGYAHEWHIRKGAERAISVSPEKVRKAIDKAFGCGRIRGMARKNPERDEEIFAKKHKHKWSYRQISRHFNMSVSSVYEAYDRVCKKKGVRKEKLSTRKSLQGVR